MNVLILPAATEIGLEISRSLRYCKGIRLFGAAQDANCHAGLAFERFVQIPNVGDTGFVDALNAAIAEHEIDVVFPAHDDVMYVLALFRKDIEATVVSHPPKTCFVARSKSQTYIELRKSVPVCRRSLNGNFPKFIKPDAAQGSQDARVVHSHAELEFWLTQRSDFIVTEYLPGPEYTVDCFSDETGLRYCSARVRSRMKNGISMRTEACDDAVFAEYAAKINDVLDFRGAWFFQAKHNGDGVPVLMELGARISGTSAFSRMEGVNLPLLSLYEAQGVPVAVAPLGLKPVVDRCLQTRAFVDIGKRDTLYVDLDDTLLVNGQVNHELVGMLYLNRKRFRWIACLSRNTEILNVLKQHRIGIFDCVVHCGDKADAIDNPDSSVLVDDSFRERQLASAKGVLAIDCSQLELLDGSRF